MKKVLFFITVFVMSMVVMPNVYAQGTCNSSPSNITCENEGDSYTITIDEGATLTETITITKDVTINLNGKATVNFAGPAFLVKGGSLVIEGNGTITNSNGSIVRIADSSADSTVTIEKGVTLESKTQTVYIGSSQNNKTTVNIAGTLKSTDEAAFYVNGTLKDADKATVNILDGAKLTSDNGAAMYLAGYAKTTVGKATIIGKSGIGIKSGELTLNGSTVKGTLSSPGIASAETGKINETGAAIQIESNHDYQTPIKLEINGGDYSSISNSVIQEYAETGTNETYVSEISITDGVFTAAEGKKVFDVTESFTTKNTEFITGGTFNGQDDDNLVKVFLKKGLIIREDGTVVDPTKISQESQNDNTKNPDTSDINLYLLLSLIAVSGCGIAYTIKKRFN